MNSVIPVWDYKRELAQEHSETLLAIETVFQSGRLILGDSLKAFEAEFSHYCGAGFGIGVNSGTDALFLALKALNVGPGDEVITVANTAVPTVSAIVSTGATPRFVDIDPQTYLMNVGQIDSRVTSRTKCILPVHLYGQCVDMDAVMSLAKAKGVKVLEDCAQSTGAKWHNRVCGQFGDVGAFSFYPTKVLGGYGDGGMMTTSQTELSESMRRLRFYGMEKTYYSDVHGYNSRLDEIHAEILRFKLKHLNQYIDSRQNLARRYDLALAPLREYGLVLPQVAPGNDHVYYLYVVRHPKRDLIIKKLHDEKIMVNISYPWPIHIMPPYSHFPERKGSLPETEVAASEIFSLPMYPTLTFEEQDRVCDVLKKVLKDT
jgi:aminotransferase EvaB